MSHFGRGVYIVEATAREHTSRRAQAAGAASASTLWRERQPEIESRSGNSEKRLRCELISTKQLHCFGFVLHNELFTAWPFGPMTVR